MVRVHLTVLEMNYATRRTIILSKDLHQITEQHTPAPPLPHNIVGGQIVHRQA